MINNNVKYILKNVSVFVFLPLFLGACIYYYTRPSSIYFLKWINYLSSIKPIYKVELPYWIVYHLPDALWAFAFTSSFLIIWNKTVNKQTVFWLSLPIIISILIEINYGTFDPTGLFFVIIGGSLPLLYFIVTQILINMNTKNNFKKVLSLTAITGFTFFAIASGDSESSSSGNNSSDSSSPTGTLVDIGQPLQTKYFEITVNEVSVKDRVRTGNQFADLPKEEGNKYLIINTTFKNTDTESRMIMDGSVWIEYNGQRYEFDKSETVIVEGWGTMLDQINPLTSKTTNLVYKLPAEITGTALWQPGRTTSKELINLGNIE